MVNSVSKVCPETLELLACRVTYWALSLSVRAEYSNESIPRLVRHKTVLALWCNDEEACIPVTSWNTLQHDVHG